MKAIIKKYCVSTGVAQLLDIIEVEKPNEYMRKIEAEKLPAGNIETRGIDPALICAHDLSFDRRDRLLSIDKFKALYLTTNKQFFSISFDGKKAALKILDIGQALKLYNELSQKMYANSFLFNPAAHRVDVDNINRDNASMKQREKEEQEAEEKYRENSALYVKKGSSL